MASPYALIDPDQVQNIGDILMYILSNPSDHEQEFSHPPGDILIGPQSNDDIIRELHSLGWSNPVRFADTIKKDTSPTQVAPAKSTTSTGTSTDIGTSTSVGTSTDKISLPSTNIEQQLKDIARMIQAKSTMPTVPTVPTKFDVLGVAGLEKGISRVDIDTLREEIRRGDENILDQIRRLYNLTPEKKSTDVQSSFASIQNRAKSYLPYVRRITVRNQDFYINDKYTTEDLFVKELKSTFGENIDVRFGNTPPTSGKKVVILRLEPVGPQPHEIFYNFIEKYIKRHSTSGSRLYILTLMT